MEKPAAAASCTGPWSRFLLLALPFLLLLPAGTHASYANTSSSSGCPRLPLRSAGMTRMWNHDTDPAKDIPPVSEPVLRGPNQTPAAGFVPRTACPTSGRISFPYWTENPTSPGKGGSFIFSRSILIPSSNTTLAPFSNPLYPVENLTAGHIAQPVVSKTCDAQGRCMEGYELVASLLDWDLGFQDAQGKPLRSLFLAYNGTIPGPRFLLTQGVQTFLRLHNHINCNTSTMQPTPDSCEYYDIVRSLTLHHHGGAALAPFDGWASAYTPPCSWKDYVYPNENGLHADWYHDHTLEITSITTGSGLMGTYWVKPCDLRTIPASLLALAPDGNPQYLVMTDAIFWQLPGSSYMNPYMCNTRSVFTTAISSDNTDAVAADHIFVNGRPWPQVTVQRRPYWFLLHAAAQTRTFNLLLKNNRTGAVLPVWFVGSDGGLRTSPWLQNSSFIMGSGERYHVVIDFSAASPGDAFVLNNLPTPEANFAQFCYTHLVIKFVVDGTDPPSKPFDANFTVSHEGLSVQTEEITAACKKAAATGADVEMIATTQMVSPEGKLAAEWGLSSKHWNSSNITKGQWAVAMMLPTNFTKYRTGYDDQPLEQMRRRRRLSQADAAAAAKERAYAQSPHGLELRVQPRGAAAAAAAEPRSLLPAAISSQILDTTIPVSMVQSHWMTWSITNQGGGTHPHPMHVHLNDFAVCGHTAPYYRGYELLTPKDTVFLDSDDTVTIAARFGPHQGTFSFHCHNLYHEDKGLMGLFNVTNAARPAVPTAFPNTTRGAYHTTDNYGAGAAAYDKYVSNYPFSDPLVRKVPELPYIGRDLYYAYSMPSWAHRTDPKHPGRPQPHTRELLQRILKRNYYRIFYPNNRSSLAQPIPGNRWAVVCPAGVAAEVKQ